VGPKVTLIKEGQRVGVGAQSYSCLDCRQCKNDNETYCRKQLDTYGAVWPDSGVVSQGGYSSHVRTHEHWYVADRVIFAAAQSRLTSFQGLPYTRCPPQYYGGTNALCRSDGLLALGAERLWAR
jgi:hypothetical protein